MGAAVVLAVAATTPAMATTVSPNSTYNWTLSGDSTGSGQLTTGLADNGGFDITSFSGSINGDVIGGLLGGQPGSVSLSPLGAFTFDNLIFNTSQVFDYYGVLFSLTSVPESNICGVGCSATEYAYWTWTGGTYPNGAWGFEDNNDVFAISAVPEPLTLSIFGAGLAGAAAMRRRKKAAA